MTSQTSIKEFLLADMLLHFLRDKRTNLVPSRGLEPPRSFEPRLLRPSCIPKIPARRHYKLSSEQIFSLGRKSRFSFAYLLTQLFEGLPFPLRRPNGHFFHKLGADVKFEPCVFNLLTNSFGERKNITGNTSFVILIPSSSFGI
jgi:hypothetical protein